MIILIAVLALIFAGCGTEIIAPNIDLEKATPIDLTNPDLFMYAIGFDTGDIVPVNFDGYAPTTHPARLNPANVLGPFNAVQDPPEGLPDNPNELFFGLAARTWTNYWFEDVFCNMDGEEVPDIQFAEVTWGSWHPEAALVYLTDAYIWNGNNVVPYGTTDDGIGYFAGIVWNKIGIQNINEARRLEIIQDYFDGSRDFASNSFYQDGNFGISQFYLPEEVISANGITLVDITKDIYDEFNPSSYINVGAINNGALVNLIEPYDTPITSANVEAVYGTDGNTDGYDLDAIRVYKCACCLDDSVTGMGEKIIDKKGGTWFMYNYFDGTQYCFDLQSGNPKNGEFFVGEFCIEDLGGGYYVANYEFDEEIYYGPWIMWAEVVDEHLGISDNMTFTAKPGKDDNANWGVPFYDEDGMFYIFAHFEVNYW